MTPKEKAKELVERFSIKANVYAEDTDYEYDKQCALICVDECKKASEEMRDAPYYSNLHYTDWDEVRQEINKL